MVSYPITYLSNIPLCTLTPPPKLSLSSPSVVLELIIPKDDFWPVRLSSFNRTLKINICFDLYLTLAPQTEDENVQEEETNEHYDPIAAATEGWGDDGSLPLHYDPIAAASEGWGDDGSLPVHQDPVAAVQEEGGDDGSQPVHPEPVAEAQADWAEDESPPATAVETPPAEASAETPEEEPTPAAEEVDNEEGQVTKERTKNGEMHLDKKMVDASALDSKAWNRNEKKS